MRLPADHCERIFAGEPPLLVWREFRGMLQTDLRRETGIRVDVIDKLERGVRPPTRTEAIKLGRALDIAAHNLMPHHAAYRSCSTLDELDEERIIAESEAEVPDGRS